MTSQGSIALSAPTDVQAMSGDTYVKLVWSVPDSNGGSPIKQYAVILENDKGYLATRHVTYLSSLPLIFTDLENAVEYSIAVTAENAAGATSQAATAKVTPHSAQG